MFIMAIYEPLSEISTHFPELLGMDSLAGSFRSLGRAAYTLYVSPEHEHLHVDVAKLTGYDPPLSLQPNLDATLDMIADNVMPLVDVAKQPELDSATLVRLSGILIQFTDYVPSLHSIQTPYSKVAGLQQEIQRRAREAGPQTLADQLEVALQQSDGDIAEALWQLFITSRLHARWLDDAIIGDLPRYSRDEKLVLMKEWHDSLAAFKERGDGLSQDIGGDTYYAWTHALAKVALTQLPAERSVATRVGASVFHGGTQIMHTLVHKIAHPQSVQSNHSVAAGYGNAVGAALVHGLQQPQAHASAVL